MGNKTLRELKERNQSEYLAPKPVKDRAPEPVATKREDRLSTGKGLVDQNARGGFLGRAHGWDR